MPLTIETLKTDQGGDISLVVVPGKALDASNSKDFKTSLASSLTPGAKIILDLGNLDFVDSSGLGAMVSSLRQVCGVGGDLKLCALKKPVRALIELVRMHKVFEIFNTREEALAAFGGAPASANPA